MLNLFGLLRIEHYVGHIELRFIVSVASASSVFIIHVLGL